MGQRALGLGGQGLADGAGVGAQDKGWGRAAFWAEALAPRRRAGEGWRRAGGGWRGQAPDAAPGGRPCRSPPSGEAAPGVSGEVGLQEQTGGLQRPFDVRAPHGGVQRDQLGSASAGPRPAPAATGPGRAGPGWRSAIRGARPLCRVRALRRAWAMAWAGVWGGSRREARLARGVLGAATRASASTGWAESTASGGFTARCISRSSWLRGPRPPGARA